MANKPRTKRFKKKRSVKRRKLDLIPAKVTGAFKEFNGLDPFKPSMYAKMHYGANLVLSAGTSNLYGTEHIFTLNSIFDPDWTGTGHQPYGHDSVQSLYNKYKVSACKIEIIINDPDADGMIVAATIQPPAGTATLAGKGIEFVKEQPMSTTRTINDSGKQTVMINSMVPIQAVSGLSPIQYKADTSLFAANFGASPSAIPKLRIAAATCRTGTPSVNIRVKLTYFCQFYDRKVLPTS